jgi:hypothetical protein
MSPTPFSGPLLIVGMQRSGTKLLRDLLNQHPQVGIPRVETHFIPWFVHRYPEAPAVRDKKALDRFYSDFCRTTFFQNMHARGQTVTLNQLTAAVDAPGWPGIFSAILRLFRPPGKPADAVWGDKTPTYLFHMPLLKELFPEARFLHIIRDPRDYAMSVNKTWGKHMLRAAVDWRRGVERGRAFGRSLGADYKEILYEELLSQPHDTLADVCAFIGLEFVSQMTKLDEAEERLGAAQGARHIVRSNTSKYLPQLSPAMQRRIAEVTYPVASTLPYQLDADIRHRPVPAWRLALLAMYDAFRSVQFHVSDKGLRRGVVYAYRLHRETH